MGYSWTVSLAVLLFAAKARGQLSGLQVLLPDALKVVTVKDLNPSLFDLSTNNGYYPSLLDQIAASRIVKFQKPFLTALSISEAVNMIANGSAHVLAAPVETNDKYDGSISFTQPVFGTEVVLVMRNNTKAAHLTVLGAANVMDTILDNYSNDFADHIIDRLHRDSNKTGSVFVRKTDNVSATFDIIEKYDNTTFLGRKAAMQNLLPNAKKWPNLVIDNTTIGTLFSSLGVQSGKKDLLDKLNLAIKDVENRGCLRELFWKWFPNAHYIKRLEEHGFGKDKGQSLEKPKLTWISNLARNNCNS